MATVRIFVSFDREHDRDLHDLLLEQSRLDGAGFALADRSRQGAITNDWTADARSRICAADEVVVICGEHTHEAPHVAAELRIAQEVQKPYLLLWGRRRSMCTKPDGARSNDAMYSWTREILENQISATLRNAEPLQVPENLKRH